MLKHWTRAFLHASLLLAAIGPLEAGERPAACANLPEPETVPAELRELCAVFAAHDPPSSLRSPMDIAYGSDYTPDPVQLARLRLGRPEVIQYLGVEEPPPGRVLEACDFQGNDFSTLYCLDRENFGPDDLTNLYAVDTQTAEMTYLASFTVPGEETNEGVNGLTYDSTTGRMYAVSCAPFFGYQSALYELDLKALTLTQIGATAERLCLQAMGADNEGQLWGLGGDEDVIDYGALIAIDKETGQMAVVGFLSFDIAFGQGMDFDASDNTCYLFVFNIDTFRGEMHRCDTDTGQTQLVGILGQDFPGAGHWGTGAIAAPSDCHVTLELDTDEVQAGDPLTVGVTVVHNRAETVAVPLRLSIEDLSGQIIVSRKATRTMKVGDRLDRQLILRIPKTLPPGSYMVTLDVGEMEQDTVRVTAPLTVVAASSE